MEKKPCGLRLHPPSDIGELGSGGYDHTQTSTFAFFGQDLKNAQNECQFTELLTGSFIIAILKFTS